MTPAQTERWTQIRSFRFDPPGAVIGFTDKVCQETGWPQSFTATAIDEYRRFLLLAAVAGHPVSPSPVVDQVWHVHLLYTRNYWVELCPKVLGFDLHHDPATGSVDDHKKLDDWYARTLQSYRAMFDEAPPIEVWPEQPRVTPFRHVDPRRYVVVSRPAWRVGVALVLTTLIALSAAIVFVTAR